MDLTSRRTVLKFGLASVAGAVAGCGGASSDDQVTERPAQPGPTEPIPAPPPQPQPQPLPPPPPPPAAQGGVWVALSVPVHLRKDAGYQTNSATFDPTIAIALDRAIPIQRSSIPYRAFCRAIHGEPGVLYYFGGLHSNYAGNETDRIDLRELTSITVGLAINHQPRIPPKGPESGYSAGSGAYIYKQYDTPLADGTDWMPYSRHTWCQDTWHPDWGYLIQSNYALGSGLTVGANPAGQGTQYQQSSGSVSGLVSYNWTTNKYSVAKTLANGANYSDFDPFRKSIVSMDNGSHSGQFYEWTGGDSAVARLAVNYDSLAPTSGVYANSGGNGHLIRYIEPGKYLWYFPAATTAGKTIDEYHRIYVYDIVAATLTRIPIPANVQSVMGPRWNSLPLVDMMFSFAVDRAARRVFWCAVDGTWIGAAQHGPLRIWVSSIDALTVWTEVAMTSAPTVRSNMAYDREPLKFYNGHLFYLSQNDSGGNGNLNIHRVQVDANAEIAPTFNFDRHKEGGWSFSSGARSRFSQSKHCNWAYRPADARYYHISGDVGESFTQSMASVSISAGSHSFREELDELTPAPVGYVRPASIDDGAWAYCGDTNSNPALVGKFLYLRGGDGISMRSNVYMQRAYASDAAAMADRWTTAPAVIYDPVAKRFTDAQLQNFSYVQGSLLTGGDVQRHPALWAWGSRSRGGTWDSVTNTMFRFARMEVNGGVALIAWRFDQRQARIYTASYGTVDGQKVYLPGGGAFVPGSTIDPSRKWWILAGETLKRSTLAPEWEQNNQWIDPADGKLYIVSPITGLLWCFETRGAETDTTAGLQIPFYPVGNRIPLDDKHFLTPGGASVPGGWDQKMQSYLVPFKGGLLYWCNQPGGSNGVARYAFWRRLGYAGDWTPITLPQDWACNSVAPKSSAINNDELFVIGSGGGAGVNSPWFFLVN